MNEALSVILIAEIAQAHDGSLGTAHALIYSAARAGANVVKFQAHIAAAESTPREPWRIPFSRQDQTRYEYWKRVEFEVDQWRGLIEHARQVGLEFLISPFSLEAVEMMVELGVTQWKIASGEVTNPFLLRRIASLGQRVYLSSGMATLEELDQAVAVLSDCPLTVLQCTSVYQSV